MILSLLAIALAVLALVEVRRLRGEVARLRSRLPDPTAAAPSRAEPPPPFARPPADRAGEAPSSPTTSFPRRFSAPERPLSEDEFRLLDQFVNGRDRMPQQTRERLTARLAARFAGMIPDEGRTQENYLVALHRAERERREAAPERVAARTPVAAAAEGRARPPREEAAPGADEVVPSGAPRGLDLETRVGTTWALRLGLGALAIAVALFARSVVPALTPAAKVALAYAGAVALFGVGRVFEHRQERFARPVMAAALAIGFFVSFASYFVPAMRAVPLVPALVWMALGVIAVLVLAERWGSEPTAGLAIFLGHVSAFVAGGVTDVYSLVVILFLSGAAVVLLWRHDWLPLSLFAVTAAYASHLLWAVADRGPAAAGLGLVVNLAFLASYYAIFLGADLIWWRRRQGRVAPDRGLARTLGPANLVLLATIATFLYLTTPDPTGGLAWFFFALGGLQLALAPLYRRLGNPDHVFYPALGAVLITLGFAAALDGLSLNLVLAIEAVALLVAAHMTRLRVFHLLAQVALAANFVHYWTTARFDEPALPFLIGGLAIASAYLVQAGLEEVWYGRQEGDRWRQGPRPAGVPGWLARAFDAAFGAVAPYLAYLHAAAGAVLIAHQSDTFFIWPGDALATMAVGMAVIAAAALVRRSAPLMLAATTLQGAIAALASAQPPTGSTLIGLTAVGLGVPALIVIRARTRAFERESLHTTLVLTQLAVLAALLLPLIPRGAEASGSGLYLYLAWIGVLGLAGVYLEGARVTLALAPGTPSDELAGAGRLGAGLTMLLTAVAVLAATEQLIGHGVEAPVWAAAWAAALIAAAVWRGQPAFTLGALALLALGDAYWLVGHDLGEAALGSTAVAAVLAGVPLAAGGLLERIDGRRLADGGTDAGALATYVLYLLGAILAFGWCDIRLPDAWSSVAFAALPIALVALTAGARQRRGANVAVLLMLVAVLDQLGYAAGVSAGSVADVLAPGLLLSAAVIALERVLTAGGSERTTPLAAGRVVSLMLLGTATLLAMATVQASWALGGPRTTVGWSLVGGALMVVGFAARSADHRRVALVVLGIAVVRVFAVDTRGLPDAAKTVAFLALGLSLVAVAWLYSRFGRRLKDWL